MRNISTAARMFFLGITAIAASPPVSARAGESADVGEHVIATGKAIKGLAVIPATGHLGTAQVAVAHGDRGAAIYSYEGKVVWQDESEAALLVSYYADNLLIYRKSDKPGGRVDRYSYTPGSKPEFVETQIPAAPAATTIQRTAYAALGPLRIDGDKIHLVPDRVIVAKEPVTAVAASNYFIPLTAEKTILFATRSGDIHIQALKAVVKAEPVADEIARHD